MQTPRIAHGDRVALLPGGVLLGPARLGLGDEHRLRRARPRELLARGHGRPSPPLAGSAGAMRPPAPTRSAPHRATGIGRDARAPAPLRSARRLRGLGGLLLLLLERPHLGQRLRPGDVGDRAPRALEAVVAGGLAPARRGDAVLLAEQGEEDLRLLRAEAGQLAQPLQQGRAVGGVGPEVLRPPVVALDQQPAQLLGPAGHRAGVAVQGRRPLEDADERLGVVRGEVRGREARRRRAGRPAGAATRRRAPSGTAGRAASRSAGRAGRGRAARRPRGPGRGGGSAPARSCRTMRRESPGTHAVGRVRAAAAITRGSFAMS